MTALSTPQLRLLDRLSDLAAVDRPIGAGQLATVLGSTTPGVLRTLRRLIYLRLVREVSPGAYTLSAEGHALALDRLLEGARVTRTAGSARSWRSPSRGGK